MSCYRPRILNNNINLLLSRKAAHSSKGLCIMFHRVKSEGPEQEEAPTSNQDQQEAENTQITSEASEPETAVEIDTPETNEQTTTDQQKEPQIMTEQETSTPEQEETAPTMGSYQRPGQAPARSGYPGAYPGLGGAESVSDSDRRLTIGPGITMSGEIESCDYLLVEGTVEAALKGANMLEVAESGTFYGTVEINEANISGRFEGDIIVKGRLTITSTGVVTGSISYKEIEIEAGAVLDGKLTPLAAGAPAAAKKPQAAKAAKPAAATKVPEKQPEPANTDEGLFSKTAAAAE